MEKLETENLKPAEAAAFLRCSRRKLDYLTAAKEIPFIKLGKRQILFRRSSLKAWLDRHENACQ